MMKSENIKIKVQTLDMNLQELEVRKDIRVEELKNLLAKEKKANVEDIRLIFHGRSLLNEKTLEDYNIKDENVIHMITKPKVFTNTGSSNVLNYNMVSTPEDSMNSNVGFSRPNEVNNTNDINFSNTTTNHNNTHSYNNGNNMNSASFTGSPNFGTTGERNDFPNTQFGIPFTFAYRSNINGIPTYREGGTPEFVRFMQEGSPLDVEPALMNNICSFVNDLVGRITYGEGPVYVRNIGTTFDAPPNMPANMPTNIPNNMPTNIPNNMPTNIPNNMPTNIPTNMSMNIPTSMPTNIPTNMSMNIPTSMPTNIPTNMSTNIPSSMPTNIPTNMPTNIPTSMPTNIPTNMSTNIPTSMPANISMNIPTNLPMNIPMNMSMNVAMNAIPMGMGIVPTTETTPITESSGRVEGGEVSNDDYADREGPVPEEQGYMQEEEMIEHDIHEEQGKEIEIDNEKEGEEEDLEEEENQTCNKMKLEEYKRTSLFKEEFKKEHGINDKHEEEKNNNKKNNKKPIIIETQDMNDSDHSSSSNSSSSYNNSNSNNNYNNNNHSITNSDDNSSNNEYCKKSLSNKKYQMNEQKENKEHKSIEDNFEDKWLNNLKRKKSKAMDPWFEWILSNKKEDLRKKKKEKERWEHWKYASSYLKNEEHCMMEYLLKESEKNNELYQHTKDFRIKNRKEYLRQKIEEINESLDDDMDYGYLNTCIKEFKKACKQHEQFKKNVMNRKKNKEHPPFSENMVEEMIRNYRNMKILWEKIKREVKKSNILKKRLRLPVEKLSDSLDYILDNNEGQNKRNMYLGLNSVDSIEQIPPEARLYNHSLIVKKKIPIMDRKVSNENIQTIQVPSNRRKNQREHNRNKSNMYSKSQTSFMMDPMNSSSNEINANGTNRINESYIGNDQVHNNSNTSNMNRGMNRTHHENNHYNPFFNQSDSSNTNYAYRNFINHNGFNIPWAMIEWLLSLIEEETGYRTGDLSSCICYYANVSSNSRGNANFHVNSLGVFMNLLVLINNLVNNILIQYHQSLFYNVSMFTSSSYSRISLILSLTSFLWGSLSRFFYFFYTHFSFPDYGYQPASAASIERESWEPLRNAFHDNVRRHRNHGPFPFFENGFWTNAQFPTSRNRNEYRRQRENRVDSEEFDFSPVLYQSRADRRNSGASMAEEFEDYFRDYMSWYFKDKNEYHNNSNNNKSGPLKNAIQRRVTEQKFGEAGAGAGAGAVRESMNNSFAMIKKEKEEIGKQDDGKKMEDIVSAELLIEKREQEQPKNLDIVSFTDVSPISLRKTNSKLMQMEVFDQITESYRQRNITVGYNNDLLSKEERKIHTIKPYVARKKERAQMQLLRELSLNREEKRRNEPPSQKNYKNILSYYEKNNSFINNGLNSSGSISYNRINETDNEKTGSREYLHAGRNNSFHTKVNKKTKKLKLEKTKSVELQDSIQLYNSEDSFSSEMSYIKKKNENTQCETEPKIVKYIQKIDNLMEKNKMNIANCYNKESFKKMNSTYAKINKIISSMHNKNLFCKNKTHDDIYENLENRRELLEKGMNHLMNKQSKINPNSHTEEIYKERSGNNQNNKKNTKNQTNQSESNQNIQNRNNNNNNNNNNSNNNYNPAGDSNSDSEPDEVISCSEESEEDNNKLKNKQKKENPGILTNTKQTIMMQPNVHRTMPTENNIFENVPEIVKKRYLNWTQNTQIFSGLMIKICKNRRPLSYAYNSGNVDSKKNVPLNNLFNYVWDETMSSLSIESEDPELEQLSNVFDLHALEFINKVAKDNKDYSSEKEKYSNVALCEQLFKEMEQKKDSGKREERKIL